MKPQRITCTTEINAKPEQIWPLIADVTQHPEWAYREGRFPYLVESYCDGEPIKGLGANWVDKASDGQIVRCKIVVWEPETTLVYERQRARDAPMKIAQRHMFALEPTGDKTIVLWSVVWEPADYSWLGRRLLYFTGRDAFEEVMAGSLENLKELVEIVKSNELQK